jgi:hypothetical protein
MKHVPPPEGELLDASILPSDITAQDLPVAIGRLRKEARDEIDRLIGFLDKTDDYVSRELEDAVDDGPIDDNELEPSLCGVSADIGRGESNISGEDLEGDDTPTGRSAEDEPSLGFLERHPSTYGAGRDVSGNQDSLCTGQGGDLEDEHDGAEPDDNEGGDGAREDDEPSLGWPERLRQDYASNGSQSGSDLELQDHATVVPKANRKKLPNTIDVEQRGYGGRTVIRNLTDGQTEALAQKLDRYGRISLK